YIFHCSINPTNQTETKQSGSQWWDQKTSDAPSAGNTCQGVASHHHSDQKTSDNPSAADSGLISSTASRKRLVHAPSRTFCSSKCGSVFTIR
ncbi:7319_t:CDS:2, partial [Funneliformis geosporum]